jgi:type II secretory pathway pseudopilin PulG
LINKNYIKASSLIETVIAIAIIAICSLIGTLVYSKVLNQTSPLRKYEYTYQLEKLIQEALVHGDLQPVNRKYEGFSIQKRVDQNPIHKNLKDIRFLVINQKDSLTFSMELFYHNDAEN